MTITLVSEQQRWRTLDRRRKAVSQKRLSMRTIREVLPVASRETASAPLSGGTESH